MLGIACLDSGLLVKYNTYLVTNKSLSPINSLNQKVKIDRSAELGIVGIVNTFYIYIVSLVVI